MKIGTVIHYSSQDNIFIRKVIEECQKFSEEIVISTCHQFFDGSDDNDNIAHELGVTVNYFDFHEDIAAVFGTRMFHNFAHVTGAQQLSSDITHILLIDADEIPEGDKVLALLNSTKLDQYTSIKFANYWYYKTPKIRAVNFEDSIILTTREQFELSLDTVVKWDIHNHRELYMGNNCLRMFYKRAPIFHHYSWAKPAASLRAKVETWGHKQDRQVDWKGIVETIIATPEGETTMSAVNGYALEYIENPIFNFDFE